jgi:hypothetical protein
MAPKADLVYAATGLRKTSNIGLAALYFWNKLHKRTRLVSADGGGWEPVQSLVDEGIIVPWQVALHRFPLTAMQQACQGHWPVDVNDPATQLKPLTKEEWEGIALVAYEGLTSFGDLMLQWFRRTGQKLSQDASYSYDDGGGISWFGSNMSQYGEVQNRIYDYVMSTNRLPCDKVLWTALEGKGEEEGSKAPIYGPAIAGKKAVGKAGQWFGNMLHIEAAVIEGAVDKDTKQIPLVVKPTMYLRPHADPVSKIPFHAKTRAPFQFAAELPEKLEPPDIAALYKLLDALNEKARASLKQTAATKP